MWKTSLRIFFIHSQKVQLHRSNIVLVHITFFIFMEFFSLEFHYHQVGVSIYQDIEEWKIGALAQAQILSDSLILSNKPGSWKPIFW